MKPNQHKKEPNMVTSKSRWIGTQTKERHGFEILCFDDNSFKIT